MKMHHLLLTSLLLVTLLTPALLAEPCAAAFIPGNNVTLERDGMTWNYDEKITDNEAVFFRSLIDGETGNNNGFVNAWEILKMEILLRDKMEKTIEEESDVKLNSTSDTVELKDIEFWISAEALGRTEKRSSITNRASVMYGFKEEAGPGTTIWLMGTPDSSVTITLPKGFDAELTEGLENKSIEFENKRTLLRGNFSSEKNITIKFSENESFKAELQDKKINMNKSAENKSLTGENKTLNAGINTEARQPTKFFKNILNEINRSLI
ncbi:hypothetical protein MSHOH_3908 [Methanosarcina horonobensis HB-1 = JCM 15518]|uniref:Uncharacterized protein n=1 Tax=Methanosarcina horonobensis HB-1 = JCM 15518 TaxID=1434110 RepID=A0A0E3SGV5_9EURY|nr:hypothetical protein MSHOH_3908 [Methanosarcina horonobensis HB-1 = JCM 15518]